MADRLLVGVLGNRNSGKSHTWNTTFGRTVKTGQLPRLLELRSGQWVEVFLVSGSFEERGIYAGEILENQNCRIVLCSMQYTECVRETIDYFIDNKFFLYTQWLNPGFSDPAAAWDRLGISNEILSASSVLSIRDGKCDATDRAREIREYIYGWSTFRDLVFST